MPADHWSSCSLHRIPAFAPGPCDCGRLSSGRSPARRYARHEYTRLARVHNMIDLWYTWWVYLRHERGWRELFARRRKPTPTPPEPAP